MNHRPALEPTPLWLNVLGCTLLLLVAGLCFWLMALGVGALHAGC